MKKTNKRSEKWRKSLAKGRHEAQIAPSVLRLVRLKKNVNQSVLAKKSGLSQGTFCGIERGKRPLSIVTATAISKQLKVPTSKLFKLVPKTKKLVAIKTRSPYISK
jgi:transcriptional regulator with XRE-family HTH domain